MSVSRSMSWSVGCQILSFVIGFGSSLITARLLTPLEMGLNAIAVAAMGMVQIVAMFGVSAYVIRDEDLEDKTVDLAFSVNAVLSCAFSAILFVISPFSAILLGDVRAGEVLQLLALTPLLNIFSFRASTLLQREMRFKAYSMVLTTQVAVTSVVTILLAWTGWSYLSAATANVVSMVVTVTLYNLAAPHHFSVRMRFDGWRQIARFGLQVMSVGGVAVLAARLCEIILGRVLGIAMLGIYSRAATISNLIFDNLYGGATRVIFSHLSQSLREEGELGAPFLRMFKMLLAVMWPLQIGLAILAPPVVYWLFGAQWIAAAQPLALLMVAQAVVLSFGMNWELFVLRGETGRQARLEFWRALIGVGTFTIGCHFGLGGAATGRVAEATIGHILYRGHVDRLAGVAKGQTMAILFQSLALTLAAVAPCALLMAVQRWSSDISPVGVAASVLLGILLWAALLYKLRHPLLDLLPRRLFDGRGDTARSR